jgi:hypothetical protein
MNDKKNKTEADSPFRTPKPKKKLGLKVPTIRMPHVDLIKPEFPKLEAVPETTLTSLSSQTSLSTPTSQTNHTRQSDISPTRDFQKVPNSITKAAIPLGLFKGKSKQLYDTLYSLTRGAIQPVRKTRVRKSKLTRLAGIGSRITFDSNIQHLISVGLIKETVFAGEHEGNEFEVLTPDEISLPSQSSQTSHAQKLDRLVSLESSQTSQCSEATNTGISEVTKTFFNTLSFKIDDEAPIINVLEKLNTAARKLTGKDLTKRDLEKFSDLLEILISETVIAGARVDTVSAFVPFMTENLRRRLYSKARSIGKKESRHNHLNVGKRSGPQGKEDLSWKPQTPLTVEQRKNTLKVLKEAKEADTIFFREFKTYGEIEYTSEDFKWLVENIVKGSQ